MKMILPVEEESIVEDETDRKGQSVQICPYVTRKVLRRDSNGQGAKDRFMMGYCRGGDRKGALWLLTIWLLCSTCISKCSVEAQRLEDSSGIDDFDSQSDSTLNSLPFDRGGTRPRCWNATAQFSDGIFPAEAVTFQDCVETTHLTVEVQTSSPVRRTPQGWQVSQNEPLNVALQGTIVSSSSSSSTMVPVDDTSLAVLVIQLCPVGFQSRCTPLVPPRPDMVPTTEPSPMGGLVTWEYTSILSNGTFMGQSSLSDAPPGIYSLLGSLIVFGNDPFLEGVSMVPIASGDEQFVTILYDTETVEVPVTVQDWAVNLVIALCIVGGSIVLILLIGTYYYRKTQVFALSQGKFIIAMLLSGLVATTSLVLLEPKNDLYCELYQPLITLPMHIMFAILVGRMWRIRAIISPLLLLTMEKKEHWTTKWVNMVERITRMECLGESVKPREKKIRISISDGQLIRVIGLFCLPQVTVQILILAMEDQSLVTRPLDGYGDFESCKNTYFNNPLGILALTFLVLQFVVLILLAGASRDLPSLFNETQSLLSVALLAFRMVFVGALILVGTHTYPSAVTAQYIVLAFLAGVTVVHTCLRITWPKFLVATSGSKIVVTKLISAHNEMRTRAHSITSSGGLVPSDPYNRNNLYGGSMMTGIIIPRTYDQTAIFSSLTGHSSAPKGLVDSQATPRSSDGAFPGNLETLQEEEDDKESSDNGHGGINGNTQQNDGNENTTGDRAGDGDDDDLQSTASSVIMIEESNDTPKVTRYQSLYSSSTVDRKRHVRLSPSQTGNVSAQDISLSFARAHSEASMAGDNGFKNTRVLSRRALLHGSPSTTQIITDVENRPQDQPLQESTNIPPPPDSPLPPGTKNDDNRNLRQRPARGRGSKERISNAGHRMISFLSGGSIVKSDVSRRSTSSSDRIKSMIPLTIEYNPKRISDTIVVAEDEPPPRRLLLRMIDVQRMLAKVNQAILTGLSVSPEDWEEIRDACVALGDVFVREVDFDWERFHEEDGFETSGEFNMNDSQPSDSPIAVHPNSQSADRGMAKQISWKPGLIGEPPQLHLDENPIRPSILRGRDSHAKPSEITVDFTRPSEPLGDRGGNTKVEERVSKK